MNTKLYLGPMSKNIVDAAIEFSNEDNIPLGFCASRRQIDFTGGYVNNWTTEHFSNYVKMHTSNILVCRDHGGPGQGSKNDDGFDSFLCDSYYMDIIHIDPWVKYKTIDDIVNKTVEAMTLCNSINSKLLYEVGTEQAIRRISSDELSTFLHNLKTRLGDALFGRIIYAVIQSGTSLKEDKNTGEYDAERLKRMIAVCQKYNVFSKEHNGDYLSGKIIREKFNLGLDAINIAPEFGLIETTCILDRLSDDDLLFDEVHKLCYNSGKWKKWVDDNFDPFADKRQLIKICCHYIFSNKRFKEIMSLDVFAGINDEIKNKIKNRIVNIVG